MTRLEQVASILLLVLGGLAVLTGILAWSVAPMVFGGVLVLAALWFRRSLIYWAEHLTNQHAMLIKMELHARILQRKEGEDEREPRDATKRKTKIHNAAERVPVER